MGVVTVKVPRTKSISTLLVLLALASGSHDVAAGQEQDSDDTVFKAEALLLVRHSMAPMIETTRKSSEAEDRLYANTQRVLLKSPFVLTAALRKPGISELSLIKGQDEPLQWLVENIQCEFVDNSQILRVSVSGKDSRELSLVVDAVVDSYLYEVVQSEQTEASNMLQTLRQQRRSNEKTIREKAEIVHHLAEELGSADSTRVPLLRELNLHELKLLFDRRERLTSKMDDVSDELHVLEALSSENTDSADHDVQKQVRVLTLRKKLLKARIDTVEARIAESRETLTQLVGFSADLETRKSELMSLHEANHEIAKTIQRMELELKGFEPRVQKVQPAVVTKIDGGNSGRKVDSIKENE
jgi:hypothetical protein